jgi:hypothetical protein
VFLYIDATAGGLIIQVLLGGFAGIGLIGRLLWGRLTGRASDDQFESDATELDGDLESEQTTDRAA